MPTLTAKKPPKAERKPKPKPVPSGPSLADRLIDAMRGIAANARGEDNDELRYSLPSNATLAQVRTARRAAGAALRLLADIRARPDYWRDQLYAADSARPETPS